MEAVAPVLSGHTLQFFRENCKLLRTLLVKQPSAEFDTSLILDKLEGNQREIARKLFAREEIASWKGGYEVRGFHREDRVLRPQFVNQTPERIADIDHVLEFLMVDAGQNINIEDPINRAAQGPNTAQNRQRKAKIYNHRMHLERSVQSTI